MCELKYEGFGLLRLPGRDDRQESRAAWLKPKITGWFIAAALALFSVVWSSSAWAKVSLVFGTYSSDKPSAMVMQLRPSLDLIAQSMEKILGEDVEIGMKVVRLYDDGVGLIVAGEVDFMRLGPASYVRAKDGNPGIEVLAMESLDGAKEFFGVIAVRADSDITEIGQLKGRTFAFGSENSTLGRYFSQLYLMRHGVLAKDLARYEYMGRHDKVGRAVGSGLFDAGALEGTTFGKLVKAGVPIRALAQFRNSTRPWVARAGLDPKITGALRQALLDLHDPEALKALRFDGFLPGSDDDYAPTREAIRENYRFFAQQN